MVDVEGPSPSEPGKKVCPKADEYVEHNSSILPLCSSYPSGFSLFGVPPVYDSLQEFEIHIQEEYGGFHQDQMQQIQDFKKETDDTPFTM